MNAASETAACCAAFYEQDWVRTLLGDSFHPGGPELSGELVADLDLAPGDRVLDLACGTGTTALLVHDAWEVQVVGVDYSEANLQRAKQRARGRESIRFQRGPAHSLPFEDDSVRAVLCECAVSTFADKLAVAREITRVLQPGGRFFMTDMAVYGALPEDVSAFGQGWACVDDALTIEGYQELFTQAGLRCNRTVDVSDGLRSMMVQLKKKLLLAGLGQLSGALDGMGVDLDTLRGLLEKARALVDDGTVRYGRLDFSLGEPSSPTVSARRDAPPNECDPSTGCCP